MYDKLQITYNTSPKPFRTGLWALFLRVSPLNQVMMLGREELVLAGCFCESLFSVISYQFR